MLVPYDILGYIQEKFPNNRVVSAGTEIQINSIFIEDHKKKLYINAETGKWICFKTGNKGNFTSLVSHIENLSYKEAERFLTLQYAKANLYKKNPTVFEHNYTLQHVRFETTKIPFQPTGNENPIVIDAWKYLYSRGLLTENKNYYAGVHGNLKGRVVLPFEVGDIIVFYQARSLYNKHPKYLNCSQSKKSAILYPFDTNAKEVVICEGPIDAISLQIQGVNATAIMGSNVSNEQLDALKKFNGRLIVGLDNDPAGKKGLLYFNKMRLSKKIEEISFIFPPDPYKDWNAAHVNGVSLQDHVNENKKVFDFTDQIAMSISPE